MRKRMLVLLFTAVYACASFACGKPVPASSPEKRIPCEIKLLLNNDLVLDEEQFLLESVLEKLALDPEYESYEAAFLDTADRAYLASGWVNRIRRKEGKKKYTIKYKKRYKVSGGDLASALAAAEADGFSLNNQALEAEVDWGYINMTLSFTDEVDLKKDKKEDGMPKGDAAIEIVAEHMPSSEKISGSGTLEFVGPLKLKRYNGLKDADLCVEVWEIPDGEKTWYITEYSKECASVEEAVKVREDTIKMLDDLGILMHEDGLKTEMILKGPQAVKKKAN